MLKPKCDEYKQYMSEVKSINNIDSSDRHSSGYAGVRIYKDTQFCTPCCSYTQGFLLLFWVDFKVSDSYFASSPYPHQHAE